MNSWRPNNCSNFPNPLAHSIDNRRLLIIPLLPLSASSLPIVGTRWHDTHTTAERLVREWAADVSHGSRKRNRWWVELSFSFTLSEIWTNNKTPPYQFLLNILFVQYFTFLLLRRIFSWKKVNWWKSYRVKENILVWIFWRGQASASPPPKMQKRQIEIFFANNWKFTDYLYKKL